MAENEEGTARESLLISVLPEIRLLSAEPSVLVQDVQQDLRLRWEFYGATLLDNQPDAVLESQQLPAVSGVGLSTSGLAVYSVRPSGSVGITLFVRGEDGTENTRTLQLTFEPPRCVLSNPSAQVYAGPGEAYPARETLSEQPLAVQPQARDSRSEWLQLRTEEGATEPPDWVRVADFTCQNFRVNQLRVAEDIPPPPTPEPTPEPTLQLTPSVLPRTPGRTPTPLPPTPQRTPSP
ncbi:MAG: hypothetical protein HC915_13340 [Anaerolineae bacterium]|nr:hypothetical protein [Anaerolineae bacterium]